MYLTRSSSKKQIYEHNFAGDFWFLGRPEDKFRRSFEDCCRKCPSETERTSWIRSRVFAPKNAGSLLPMRNQCTNSLTFVVEDFWNARHFVLISQSWEGSVIMQTRNRNNKHPIILQILDQIQIHVRDDQKQTAEASCLYWQWTIGTLEDITNTPSVFRYKNWVLVQMRSRNRTWKTATTTSIVTHWVEENSYLLLWNMMQHFCWTPIVMHAWGKHWVIYISLKVRLGATCMKLTIVIKISMHFCSQKGINASMSYYFSSPRYERDHVL